MTQYASGWTEVQGRDEVKGSKNKAADEDDSMTVGKACQQQTEGVQMA